MVPNQERGPSLHRAANSRKWSLTVDRRTEPDMTSAHPECEFPVAPHFACERYVGPRKESRATVPIVGCAESGVCGREEGPPTLNSGITMCEQPMLGVGHSPLAGIHRHEGARSRAGAQTRVSLHGGPFRVVSAGR